jgi:hypothetical protein
MFAAMRKRWILRSYRTRLPAALRRDYGKSEFYTPAQIRASIERHGFSDAYFCYALSLYTDQVQFDAYHAEQNEICDYTEMREMIASHAQHHSWTDMLQDVVHSAPADTAGTHADHSHASSSSDFGSGHGHH